MEKLESIIFNHPMNAEKVFNKIIDKYHEHGSVIVGVDFDDTLKAFTEDAEGDYSQILNLLKECKQLGFTLCLWTLPYDLDNLQWKAEWCKEQGIEMDYINESPVWIDNGMRKPFFNILLDDNSGLQEAFTILYNIVQYVKREKGLL